MSDLVCRLFTEAGLGKSLAILTDIVLVVGSGEDNGDNLYGDGEESISSCCCGGPVITASSISESRHVSISVFGPELLLH